MSVSRVMLDTSFINNPPRTANGMRIIIIERKMLINAAMLGFNFHFFTNRRCKGLKSTKKMMAVKTAL